MTTETKHTPTPWTIGGDGADIFGPGTAPSYSDSHHVATCQTTGDGLLGMGTVDVHNAAFIVRACNAHDDLVAACEALDKSWTETWPGGPDWVDPKGNISIHPDTLALWRPLRAALAKAKGQ